MYKQMQIFMQYPCIDINYNCMQRLAFIFFDFAFDHVEQNTFKMYAYMTFRWRGHKICCHFSSQFPAQPMHDTQHWQKNMFMLKGGHTDKLYRYQETDELSYTNEKQIHM